MEIMKPASPRTYVSVLTHVLVWSLIGLFLLLWQPLTWKIDIPIQFWVKQGVLFLFLVLVFYINSWILIPRLLLKNKYLAFILINVGATLVVSYVVQQLELAINMREHLEKAFKAAKDAGSFLRKEDNFDYFSMLCAMMVLGISTSLTAVQSWQKDIRLREHLEKEKLNSELSFLKAQINPHFFFNTLNNIYALTIIDVEASREALHKLSRMMRYVLYETQNATVLLSHELSFIEDYIQLMRLRLTEKVTIEFDKPELLSETPIAPMILLPFVENAFKHGVSSLKDSYIKIAVSQDENVLTLQVKNTLFDDKKEGLDESNGIGLVNTRRRLDILYPEKYDLSIKEDKKAKTYSVQLKLNVA
jgi:two-component system LytT family sensor kinase